MNTNNDLDTNTSSIDYRPASEGFLPSNKSQAAAAKKQGFLTKHLDGFKAFGSLFGILITSAVLSILMLAFVFRTYTVEGSSMEPTLHNADKIIVNKFTKTRAGEEYQPVRGQIIVFDSELLGKSVIKRVIGLPGERVSMTNGRFLVKNAQYPNGFDPDASYEDLLPNDDPTTFEETTVPEGQLFVSGDNRSPGKSLDSRSALGFVPISEVVGTAEIRYFPFDDSGHLR